MVTIKSHGGSVQSTKKEMMNTNRNGIILIRNPFRALYGYRNYLFGGVNGYAEVSRFVGEGIIWSNYEEQKLC